MNLHVHTEDDEKSERDGKHLDFVFEEGCCIQVLAGTGAMLPGAPQIGGKILGVIPALNPNPSHEPIPLERWKALEDLAGKQFRLVIECADGKRFVSAPILIMRKEKPRSDPPNAGLETVSMRRPASLAPARDQK
jgi:hypothetical protein